MQDFRRIEAWRLCRPLVVDVYRATRAFPIDERFGLTLQVRKSANAIGASIAEAFGRATRTDCARVLQTAISEGNETLHHLIVAHDLGYIADDEFNDITRRLEVIRTKVFNLAKQLRRRRRG
jgi:four helix bundle protein